MITGYFIENKFEGSGVYTFSDGRFYEGKFLKMFILF
jgi:hypothetical protein